MTKEALEPVLVNRAAGAIALPPAQAAKAGEAINGAITQAQTAQPSAAKKRAVADRCHLHNMRLLSAYMPHIPPMALCRAIDSLGNLLHQIRNQEILSHANTVYTEAVTFASPKLGGL